MTTINPNYLPLKLDEKNSDECAICKKQNHTSSTAMDKIINGLCVAH